jgi:prepilin-type N-terminal cleavage/methylation domain-containing protein
MILSAMNRHRHARVRGGFTLVELLVVIVVLSILIGLLLPAINAAIRTAKKAAVSSEINQLAAALASFKSKFGDYPPSRVYLAEDGNYTALSTTAIASGDISLNQLGARTVSALRKFWPRVNLSTSGGAVFSGTMASPPATWYDFNGDGKFNGPWILEGHQCLTFFLGGIPTQDSNGNYGMTGFAKDPSNPFTSLNMPNGVGTNRQPPLFEFVPSRLFTDPNDTYGSLVPGYYDSLGGVPGTASGLNFYAYFSAYGNNGYDPNDVNFPEVDANNNGPIGLNFQVTFPNAYSVPSGYVSYVSVSAAPNPYTTTLSVATGTSGHGVNVVSYINAQSFQIISSGIDGLYGVGGQYVTTSSSSGTSTNPLPIDTVTSPSPYANNTTYNQAPEATIRQREGDNLTNFKASSLQ